jgi:hypothetical protein
MLEKRKREKKKGNGRRRNEEMHEPCLVICNTRVACRICSVDRGFRALLKLQFQCLNVDWNDTLFLRYLWIIARMDEINLSSVYCKSSSSSSSSLLYRFYDFFENLKLDPVIF